MGDTNNDYDANKTHGDAAAGSGGITVGGSVNGNIIVGDKNTINQYAAPTPQSFLHQLPAPPPDFTGRKKELDELTKAVNRGVTISGVQGQGGVGKTALALQLAQELLPLYPDAQFFLDLRGVSDSPLTPAEAMAHVIRAYYPNERLPDDVQQLKANYQSVLHNQKALLLMDNAKDKDQVMALIPPHTCCFIVTSRQHFALPGLQAQNLEVMSADDARDLLMAIAPRLAPTPPSPIGGVTDGGGFGEGVNEIASLCAYLPLALRAAASTLAEEIDLDPTDYVKQLRDEKTRLGLKAVTATTGEISVEASLNLSYARLSQNAQRTLQRLSIFPDDFDANAAETVCEDEGHKSLSELVKRSLVNYKGRYKLHDLTRLFASHRLPDTERYTTQLRHAQHYLEVIRTADNFFEQGNDSISQGLALFDLERLNIEHGQKWASQNAKNDDAAQVCNIYPDAGTYVIDLRLHPRTQIQWREDALKAARQLKHREAEGVHLGNLGIAYAALGETRKAIEFYEQRLTIAREIGDRRGEGNALGNLGIAYAALGETRKAIEFFEQQLTIVREIGDRRGEGNALGNLGNAYFYLGETRKAIEFYEQSLIISEEIEDKSTSANLSINVGLTYLIRNMGDELAEARFVKSQIALEEIGDKNGLARCLLAQGMLAYVRNEDERARQFYLDAERIASETEARPIIAATRLFRSPLEGVRLTPAEAIKLVTEAKTAFDEMGMKVADENMYEELLQMFMAGKFPK